MGFSVIERCTNGNGLHISLNGGKELRFESKKPWHSDEHQRTPMNTETLITDLGWKERGLTSVTGAAERCRGSLVRSG